MILTVIALAVSVIAALMVFVMYLELQDLDIKIQQLQNDKYKHRSGL